MCSTAKTIERDLESVLDYGVKMVNQITFRPLNARVFEGTWWCTWLRHNTTSPKVADLIPYGVTGIFY